MTAKKTAKTPAKRTGPIKLVDISPDSWEHPTDRAALGALQQIPGFDALLKKIVGVFGEININTMFQAAAVRVGPDQYPDIHSSLVRACETLDTEVPPLFISQTPIVNAGAIGMDHPFIVLNSSLIELASPAEVEVVLGHEVGHIMSEHALYRTLLILLLQLSPALPIVSQAVVPITLALQEWSRKAEISSDRAGLLATQDFDAAMGMHAVLAGGIRGRREELNMAAFIEQSDQFRSAGGLSAYYRFMATLGRSHPFPVIRVAELRNWVDSGEYNDILKGNYRRRTDPRPVRDDMSTAGRNFSDSAAKVFEDTDRYVNEALNNFVGAARKLFDDTV